MRIFDSLFKICYTVINTKGAKNSIFTPLLYILFGNRVNDKAFIKMYFKVIVNIFIMGLLEESRQYGAKRFTRIK